MLQVQVLADDREGDHLDVLVHRHPGAVRQQGLFGNAFPHGAKHGGQLRRPLSPLQVLLRVVVLDGSDAKEVSHLPDDVQEPGLQVDALQPRQRREAVAVFLAEALVADHRASRRAIFERSETIPPATLWAGMMVAVQQIDVDAADLRDDIQPLTAGCLSDRIHVETLILRHARILSRLRSARIAKVRRPLWGPGR